MKIVHVNFVLNDVVGVVIVLAINHAWLDATACHPDRERGTMVIATVFLRIVDITLTEGGPAKFATPNDEGILEKTPLLQILDESRRRLIGVLALDR